MAVAIGATIAYTIISSIITGRLSAWAAAAQAAEEFYAFKALKDDAIMDMAIILGQNTDLPYYEWFKVLQTIQNLQMAGMRPTQIDPPVDMLPEPPPEKSLEIPYMILAGFGLAVLLFGGKKR
jgi:hypothetical protein